MLFQKRLSLCTRWMNVNGRPVLWGGFLGFFCGQSLSVLEEDCEGRPFKSNQILTLSHYPVLSPFSPHTGTHSSDPTSGPLLPEEGSEVFSSLIKKGKTEVADCHAKSEHLLLALLTVKWQNMWTLFKQEKGRNCTPEGARRRKLEYKLKRKTAVPSLPQKAVEYHHVKCHFWGGG